MKDERIVMDTLKPLIPKKEANEYLKKIMAVPKDKNIVLALHKNPPPDADGIATALILQNHLDALGIKADIFGEGAISDPQAKALINRLDIEIKDAKFWKENQKNYGLIIFCDCGINNVSLDVKPDIIIDHHPKNVICEDCLVIKKEAGACATIVYYLIKELGMKFEYPNDIAAALVVGIATDTDSLSRETAVRPYDIEAHRELAAVMNQQLFYRLTINYETPKTLWKCLMNGLKNAENLEEIFIGCLALMDLGEISHGEANNIPRIADGLKRVPGIRLSVVIGTVNKEFIRACVRTDLDISLDQFCKDVFGADFVTDTGKASGGGRDGTAGATIPLSNRERWLLHHYDEVKKKEFLAIIKNSYLDIIKEKYLPNP